MLLNSTTDLIGGIPLTTCPQVDSLHLAIYQPYTNDNSDMDLSTILTNATSPGNSNMPHPYFGIYNPTISLTYCLQAMLALIFCIHIIFRYSRVKVFGRRIKTKHISNRPWIWYFMVVFLYSGIDATRYLQNIPYFIFKVDQVIGITDPVLDDDLVVGLFDGGKSGGGLADKSPTDEQLRNIDSGLLLTSTILRLLGLLLLVFALQWQYIHRSGLIPFRETVAERYYSPSYLEENRLNDDDEDDDDGEYNGDEYEDFEEIIVRNDEENSPLLNPFKESGLERISTVSLLSPINGSTRGNRYRFSRIRSRLRRRKGIFNRLLSSFLSLLYQKHRNKYVFRYNRLAICLFFVNLFFLYADMAPVSFGIVLYSVYLGTFAAMQLPIWILTLKIVTFTNSKRQSTVSGVDSRSNTENGPSIYAKVILLLAIILNTFLIVPPSVVSLVLHVISGGVTGGGAHRPFVPGSYALFGFVGDHDSPWLKCYYSAFAMTDIVNWLLLISNVLLFLFVRSEFIRVKGRTIRWTVRTVTGTFGFGHSEA